MPADRPTTAAEVRAAVERAKAEAMARFVADYGRNAEAGLQALRRNNAKALADICKRAVR